MSFKLKFLGQEKEFDGRVKLLDLLPAEDKKKYVCARVNNRSRELTYEVNYEAKIIFWTISSHSKILCHYFSPYIAIFFNFLFA